MGADDPTRIDDDDDNDVADSPALTITRTCQSRQCSASGSASSLKDDLFNSNLVTLPASNHRSAASLKDDLFNSNLVCSATGPGETILQIDGNATLQTECDSEEELEQSEEELEQSENANIDESNEPPAWYEPHCKRPKDIPTARTTIRTDNRAVAAAALPSFSAPNCRSLGPKLKNFQEDMMMRDIDVAMCSETWEKSNNKEYQKNIEEMLELKGLKMISNPRKYQRGGGVCIIANTAKVNIQTVETANPDNVEAVFALVKPLAPPPEIKEIVTFAFYCPPRSRKMNKLIDFLVTNIHSLLARFPNAGIMGGGDRNSLDISPIIAAVPRLLNIQQLPTLNDKSLDVLLTTMAPLYSIPIIAPPVTCDDPSKGAPSDHSVPIVYPITNATLGKQQKYKEQTTRPLPESAVRKFGLALIDQEWAAMSSKDSSEKQEETMQNILSSLLSSHCPTKTVKLRPQVDKPFITYELKTLDRQRKREYRKHRKSPRYCYLNNQFNTKYRKASKDYLDKMMLELEESNPAKANKIIKRLGAQPGETLDEGNFSLPDHRSLTAEQSANKIAQKFAEISQEYPPIKIENLPERVQNEIKNAKKQNIPYISRQMVEDKVRKAKTTKGGVDGDLPAKLIKEFSSELAPPLSQLYRAIAQTGKWPSRWKAEQGTHLKKTH